MPGGGEPRLELRSPIRFAIPISPLPCCCRRDWRGFGGWSPPAPTDVDLLTAPAELLAGLEKLPESLGEAIDRARNSAFVQRSLPGAVIDKILDVKRYEWERYTHTEDKNKFEHARYFERV